MEGLKITLLVLTVLATTASAQPTSAASGGIGTLDLVLNWGQVAVESLLEWTKNVLFHSEVEGNEFTGSSLKILWLDPLDPVNSIASSSEWKSTFFAHSKRDSTAT